jgi:phosphoribosyl 1,2-cyclic phosphate phosphodiesterase
MSAMLEVRFLGTGTSLGVPMVGCACATCKSTDVRDQRLRSSVLLSIRGKNIVIDTGPDFRQQMLRSGTQTLDAVVFTHEHKDHLSGLDEVRAFNYFMEKNVPVYAHARVEKAIRREYHYIFETPEYPGIPKIDLHRIDLDPFDVAGIKFIPIEVMHYQLPVLGFRVGNFTYITDANYISEVEKEKMCGTEILVLNALRFEKHISHFTIAEAIALAQEIGAKQTYFTHLSHQAGPHAELAAKLPKGIAPAYDGLVVRLEM